MTVRDEHTGLAELGRPPLREAAVIVRLALPGDSDDEIEESLEEMARLADTAGADVVCTVVQHRPAPSPGTLIGAGKIEEVKAIVEETQAAVVLVDSDLTPRQGSKLEKLLDCKVVDRTQLILDIFAQRAQTSEGKLQVELAQLNYILPRLAGRGSLMRQQGGIGIRGPGEQKLEVDRRVIRSKMDRIKRDLEVVRNTRRVQRKNRVENTEGAVALVGYTNAGKSSLLNAISGADVFVEDRLFATLDPRSRKCRLPSRRQIVLTDTVGFIRKLPHSLVAAFRATLEEVVEADHLLLVADAAHPAVEDHIRAVNEVLEEIGVGEKPTTIVFNKSDAADPERLAELLGARPNAIAVSALTREGLPELLAHVDAQLAGSWRRVSLRIPQRDAAVAAHVHRRGRVIDQRYEGDDIVVEAEVDAELYARVAPFES